MEKSDVELLQTAPAYHIQTIVKARLASIKRQQTGSSPTVSLPTTPIEIAQQVLDQPALATVVRDLGELESLLLRELVACGGRANSRDLALYFANSSLLTPAKEGESFTTSALSHTQPGRTSGAVSTPLAQYPVAHPHGVFEQALRHLLLLGLLYWGKQTNFVGRDYASGIHDGVLIVPEAVKVVVRDQWRNDEPFITILAHQNRDGEDVGEGVRRLQRALYLYWSFVSSVREGLTLVNNGLLSRSALRQVTEQMAPMLPKTQNEPIRGESDVPYLLFLRLLLMKLQLLQERQGSIHASAAEAFFELPLVERACRCYQIWRDTPFWNEMLYLPDVNVRPGPSPLDPPHEEVMRARQTVVERVEHERIERWHPLSTFIARTKLYAPYLLFPRQYGPRAERYMSGSNPYSWDFRLRRGWLTHREGWHMVEGGFIRTVITGPLHWLGITEIDNEDNPTSFRISPGSLFLLGDVDRKGEEIPAGKLIVQPNFELVALAPVSEALLVRLDRFAERVSLEHIAQYRITKASVTRAIQTGLHAEDIKEILKHGAGGDIPQNVQYSLIEWERQARRVEMWQGATLLEVDDATLLDTLSTDEEARPLLGRRLAPQLAEVAAHNLPAIQELLWRRDYLPSLVSAPTQDTVSDNGRLAVRESQWRLHYDGLLQPFYAVVDLYLKAEVERFSDHDDATGWRRITPSALRRARQEISLEYIVRFLQQYCEGGIPPSFLIRLKLWGDGYSGQQSISVEHAPMLRLSSQVLEDLQADNELALLLGSEVEQQSRLIRVRSDDLERVVELLKERGFSVQGVSKVEQGDRKGTPLP